VVLEKLIARGFQYTYWNETVEVWQGQRLCRTYVLVGGRWQRQEVKSRVKNHVSS